MRFLALQLCKENHNNHKNENNNIYIPSRSTNINSYDCTNYVACESNIINTNNINNIINTDQMGHYLNRCIDSQCTQHTMTVNNQVTQKVTTILNNIKLILKYD